MKLLTKNIHMKKNLYILKIAVVMVGILVFSNSAKAYTAVMSGNWSSAATWGGIAPPDTVSNQDVTIPLGINVTLDRDVTFTGLLNTIVVDGTLSGNSGNSLTVSLGALAGNGTVNIHTLTFGTLSSASFSGNLTAHKLVNQSLSLGVTALTNVSDTLYLESGTMNLNTNGNLTMGSNSTIKVNGGTVAVSGGILNLTNNYNAMYVGSSKTTGIELNSATVQHLYIMMNDNTQTVSINGNTTINGNVMLGTGLLALNGQQVTLMGDITADPGAMFTSTAASNLTINGSGALTSGLVFDAGSVIGNLTINRPGANVSLTGDVAIGGSLSLNYGMLSLDMGSTVTMNAGSMIHVEKGALVQNGGTFDGSAAYNVEYANNSSITAGPELSGTGLNNLSTNLSYMLLLSDSVKVNGLMDIVHGGVNLNDQVLILNGTLSQNPLGVFAGSANSELQLNLTSVTNDTLRFEQSLGYNTIGKLVINTAGTGRLVLGNTLSVATELNMMNGKLELGNYDLTIMPAASMLNYDDTKYIVTSESTTGGLRMNVVAGSTYVTFPIGTVDNYSPAEVQQSASASSDYFKVRAMNTVLSNATYGFVSSSVSKVVDRTWFISSPASTVDMNLKLNWMQAAELNGFDRTNAYITNYASGWDVMTPSSATAGPNNTYQLTRSGITTLSPPFAVTEDGQPINIKEVAHSGTGIDLYPNPAGAVLNIEVGNAGNFRYELTDLSGRVVTSKEAGNTQAFDVKGLEAGYYFVRITDLSANTTSIRKFIKQ
jgi:hypothetical protein